ncbi:putative 2OG-Fe(II) oxygenase [Phenylobacterium sp.]|uniref:putative 2OG-Fe(II) oxygenase n=1 Tax=Phenylobacterium sp. TaxID=1871053 RepID=UPI002FE33F8A
MTPQETRAALARAKAAFGAGDLATAGRLAEAVAASEPGLALARQIAAVVARRQGRLEDSRSHFEAALGAAPADAGILNGYANLLRDLGDLAGAASAYERAVAVAPGDPEVWVNLALARKRLEDGPGARAALQRALAIAPDHPRGLQALGVLLLEAGEPDAAAEALDRLLAREPANLLALRARARVAAETGDDAAAWIARARALAPQDRGLVLEAAVQALRDGEAAEAEAALARLVADDPGLVEAHDALAKLRWERGDGETFTASYEAAVRDRPEDRDLWLGYLGALMRAGRPEAALERLPAARTALGPLAAGLEAAAASEAGELVRADRIFAALDPAADAGLRIAFLRHLLRAGRPEAVTPFAESLARAPGGADLWPYLATAWRLTGDPRWDWLEGNPAFVRAVDLPISAAELDALAERLRALHRTRNAPYEQTLRGGTQTQGSLLARREPEIVRLRAMLGDAIRDYVTALPPPDPDHPLLGRPRGGARFAGSWSVRLEDAGFHTNHVHTTGWISSAFYVVTPREISAGDTGQAGWLTFGEPPAELGLALKPFGAVEPKPGRLALFPSTLWHGTRPFRRGERMTVAFDVVPTG